MAQPTPYNRAYNFTNYQTVYPSVPLPADQLDIELNGVKITLDELLANLELIQADDGTLAPGIVTRRSLAPDITLGFTFRGAWEDGAGYLEGDGVAYGNKFYTSTADHVAETANRPDNDGETWSLAVDFSDVVAEAAGVLSVHTFSGDGATTTFDVGLTIPAEQNAFISVDGEIIPATGYSLAGTSVVFVNAPSSGTGNIEIRVFTTSFTTDAIPANTVTVSPAIAGGSNVQSVLSTHNSSISSAQSTANAASAAAAAAQSTANTALTNAAAAQTTASSGSVNGSRLAAGSVNFDRLSSSALASQAEAEAGAVSNKLMTPQRVAQAIAALVSTGATAGRLLGVTIFKASGTWSKATLNPGFVVVEVLGGGAGGGGASNSASTAGSGGGAGGYSLKVIQSASLGSTETVTIGAGGAGGNTSGGPGGNGGSSSFGAHCSASGGNNGVGSTTGAAARGGGTGGAGSGGDLDLEGGSGGNGFQVFAAASSGGSATSAIAAGGNGGASVYGGGGNGAAASANGGAAGANTGAGGGGAVGNGTGRSGGAGGSGLVVIWEFA